MYTCCAQTKFTALVAIVEAIESLQSEKPYTDSFSRLLLILCQSRAHSFSGSAVSGWVVNNVIDNDVERHIAGTSFPVVN